MNSEADWGRLSIGSSDPFPSLIYVEGEATDEKAPDTIVLTFDVVGIAPESVKANQDVQARSAKVFALLRDRKIADNDIVAEGITSEKEFEETETTPRKRKLIGYKVTRPFTVKLRDVKGFGKLVDALIATANPEIHRSNTEYSKEKEVKKELWDKAVANAREQADQTASRAGMKVDSVFAISPTPVADITSAMFPKGSNDNDIERVIVTGSNIPTPEDWEQYRLAPISFTQIVHVIYLISPAPASPGK
jgi:uncharacterized protein YggE